MKRTIITVPERIRQRLEEYSEEMSREGENVPLYVALADLLDKYEMERQWT